MDIALVFNPATFTCDLAMAGTDLLTDDGLKTAVLISLFTDRRAEPDDALPDDLPGQPGTGNPRGWWGDWYAPPQLPAILGASTPFAPGTLPVPADRIGSRLWLLSREKQLQSVVAKAQAYCQEALAWLTDNQIAAQVSVDAEIVAPGILGLQIDILEPSGNTQNYQFQYVWGAS